MLLSGVSSSHFISLNYTIKIIVLPDFDLFAFFGPSNNIPFTLVFAMRITLKIYRQLRFVQNILPNDVFFFNIFLLNKINVSLLVFK